MSDFRDKMASAFIAVRISTGDGGAAIPHPPSASRTLMLGNIPGEYTSYCLSVPGGLVQATSLRDQNNMKRFST